MTFPVQVELQRDKAGQVRDCFALDAAGRRVARLNITNATFEYPAGSVGHVTLKIIAGHVITTDWNASD